MNYLLLIDFDLLARMVIVASCEMFSMRKEGRKKKTRVECAKQEAKEGGYRSSANKEAVNKRCNVTLQHIRSLVA